jgi:hypothetical protein
VARPDVSNLLRTLSCVGAWLASVAVFGWLGLNWPFRTIDSEADGLTAVLWGMGGLVAGAFAGLIAMLWVQIAWARFEQRLPRVSINDGARHA